MRERIERVREVILADKRKSAILGALAMVALAMWLRSGFSLGRPSSARASQPAQNEASRAGAVLATTALEIAAVRERLSRREVILPRPGGSPRDLFALAGAFLPPEDPNVTTQQESPKFPPPPVETEAARKERERLARIEQVRTDARRLRLRSVIVGQRPAVVIEVGGAGRPRSVVLRAGQRVEGFELVEIRSASVLLLKDEIPVELTLEFPQQQQ